MDWELDVRQWLEGLRFPASKRTVLDYVRAREAPAFLVMALEQIPDVLYASADKVAEKLGKIEPHIFREGEEEAA